MRIYLKKVLTVLCILTVLSCLLSSCDSSTQDFENAQKAYDLLQEAESICINGMVDIYGAWYFGQYEADECSSNTVFTKLSESTSFSASELKDDGAYSGPYLVNGLGEIYCVEVVKNCLTARGDYSKVDQLLSESKSYIKSLSKEYEYRSDFKDYHSKIASYAEFFKSPTGSFDQLQGTTSDYENSIKTAREALKFDFE